MPSALSCPRTGVRVLASPFCPALAVGAFLISPLTLQRSPVCQSGGRSWLLAGSKWDRLKRKGSPLEPFNFLAKGTEQSSIFVDWGAFRSRRCLHRQFLLQGLSPWLSNLGLTKHFDSGIPNSIRFHGPKRGWCWEFPERTHRASPEIARNRRQRSKELPRGRQRNVKKLPHVGTSPSRKAPTAQPGLSRSSSQSLGMPYVTKVARRICFEEFTHCMLHPEQPRRPAAAAFRDSFVRTILLALSSFWG